MSFSTTAKNQIISQELKKPCCQKSFIAAIMKVSGSIFLGHGLGGNMVRISTDNGSIIRKLFLYLKQLYGISPQIMVAKRNTLKKNNRYFLELTENEKISHILQDLGLFNGAGENYADLSYPIFKKDCCRRAYLMASFAISGSVTDPQKAYHLEMTFSEEAYADYMIELLKPYDIHAKRTMRKNQWVVYMKDAESISHFLIVIGAHSAVLHFEETRIVKEIRNNVQRVMNCDEANTNKTIDAAEKQLENIRLIEEKRGLKSLPEKLKEIAEIRLEYPEESLSEIAIMLGNISRSGVNHRFRKIEQIADQIREEIKKREES